MSENFDCPQHWLSQYFSIPSHWFQQTDISLLLTKHTIVHLNSGEEVSHSYSLRGDPSRVKYTGEGLEGTSDWERIWEQRPSFSLLGAPLSPSNLNRPSQSFWVWSSLDLSEDKLKGLNWILGIRLLKIPSLEDTPLLKDNLQEKRSLSKRWTTLLNSPANIMIVAPHLSMLYAVQDWVTRQPTQVQMLSDLVHTHSTYMTTPSQWRLGWFNSYDQGRAHSLLRMRHTPCLIFTQAYQPTASLYSLPFVPITNSVRGYSGLIDLIWFIDQNHQHQIFEINPLHDTLCPLMINNVICSKEWKTWTAQWGVPKQNQLKHQPYTSTNHLKRPQDDQLTPLLSVSPDLQSSVPLREGYIMNYEDAPSQDESKIHKEGVGKVKRTKVKRTKVNLTKTDMAKEEVMSRELPEIEYVESRGQKDHKLDRSNKHMNAKSEVEVKDHVQSHIWSDQNERLSNLSSDESLTTHQAWEQSTDVILVHPLKDDSLLNATSQESMEKVLNQKLEELLDQSLSDFDSEYDSSSSIRLQRSSKKQKKYGSTTSFKEQKSAKSPPQPQDEFLGEENSEILDLSLSEMSAQAHIKLKENSKQGSHTEMDEIDDFADLGGLPTFNEYRNLDDPLSANFSPTHLDINLSDIEDALDLNEHSTQPHHIKSQQNIQQPHPQYNDQPTPPNTSHFTAQTEESFVQSLDQVSTQIGDLSTNIYQQNYERYNEDEEEITTIESQDQKKTESSIRDHRLQKPSTSIMPWSGQSPASQPMIKNKTKMPISNEEETKKIPSSIFDQLSTFTQDVPTHIDKKTPHKPTPSTVSSSRDSVTRKVKVEESKQKKEKKETESRFPKRRSFSDVISSLTKKS